MLLKNLIIVLFLGSALSVSGHEYFFSYAEVEYNDFTSTLEATIVATAHDFEEALEERGLAHKLDEVDSTQSDYQLIESFLNKHFEIKSQNQSCQFNLIGIEVSLNGTVSFYLESNKISIKEELHARFDLLMNEYTEQQNKLTLLYQNKSKTFTFLPHKKEFEIELSKL